MTWKLATPADVGQLRAELAASPRIAIDTEFHAERRYLPQLFLVQVRTEAGRTWLIDPLDGQVLPAIAPDLAKPDWIVHGGAQDLRILLPLCGALPPRVLDTQIAAGLLSHRFPAGFGDVMERWLGRSIDKAVTLSDWSRRPLAREQLEYAASDVEWLLPLWDRLAEEAVARGRTELVLRACAEARDAAITPPAPDWRRLPASVILDPDGAAALEALVAWREDLARLTDTPPRVLMSDPLLIELARRRPESRQAMGANRKISKALVREHGDAIVATLAAARASGRQPAVIPHGSPASRRLAFLGALASVLGDLGGWATGLVLPPGLLEELAVLDDPTPPAIERVLGWRAPLVGSEMASALAGGLALRLVGGEVLVGAPSP